MKYILTVILLVVLAQSALASDLEYYNVDYEIDDTVIVTIEFSFKQPTDLTDFKMDLPSDVKNVNLNIADVNHTNDLKQAKKIKLIYSTQEYLEGKDHFLTNFKLPFNSDKVKVSLKLPAANILSDSVEKSAFPYPSDIKSDGQSIILEWEKNNVNMDENFSFYVLFKEKNNILIYILPLVLLLLIILVTYLIIKRTHKITKHPQIKQIKKKDYNIEIHLKEDEKQIIRALKRKNGQCNQATLAVITDFSKARLSRILGELEERNIIYREEKGNKKLVILKKASWNILEQDKEE